MKVVFRSGLSLRSMLTKVKDTLVLEKKSKVVYQVPCSCDETYIGETLRRLETGCLSEGDTGEVSPCRTCVGEPPSNQMGGDNSDRPSQDPQRTDAQGGNPHQAEPPLTQQGWWAGAAWMLDGRLEEGSPATSGDTP